MLAWCSGLEHALICVLGPGFNLCMVHFFSSTNNIIKSLQLLFCIDLYYYLYYSNIGCWGFQVVSTWNPHGNRMEFMWKFHVEGWNSYGIHKESTWNIGGKKSPKWVRSQPKHIPCGMGRFHVEQHGFHMDSTWIPCGIGGQGKDLDPRPRSPPCSIDFETQRFHKCVYVQTSVDSLVHLHDNIIDQYCHLATKKLGVSVRVGQTKSLSAVRSSIYLSQLISIFSANKLLDCIR